MLRLAPGRTRTAASAGDLALRETACCSFFAFDGCEEADGRVVLTVKLPETSADDLADRTRTLLAS